ncbi:hypothetical protein E2C01_070711 [Portunus trituberculatus]|uniref:Uncharacterized protein n=1 Tax=Portunus trituberculatus TaxID=210409 RepID=A0A5B7HTF4_PORTR|nr:hypothetical protein [Portunus trituberculatus]
MAAPAPRKNRYAEAAKLVWAASAVPRHSHTAESRVLCRHYPAPPRPSPTTAAPALRRRSPTTLTLITLLLLLQEDLQPHVRLLSRAAL